MDDAAHEGEAVRGPSRLPLRLLIGLAQGFAAAYLLHALDKKLWPSGDTHALITSYMLIWLWPAVLLFSVATRRGAFVLWPLAAAAIIAGISYYSVWRLGDLGTSDAFRALNYAATFVALPALLFIAQSLITASDTDGRVIATYPTYFDTAWKLGIQTVFASAFVVAFWIVLWMGAELFHLIGIDVLRDLTRNKWFAVPASTVAFAYAIDLTDVRAGLIGGVRNLALMLMSWILPLMALLAVAFLLTLPFTGVGPLWATKSATALLLSAAAILIVLVNAAYRDGENGYPLLIKIAGSIGAVALVPLVAIASYALMMRIGQYGLTPDRILAFFAAGIAVCFAMGYAISAVNIGGWLKGVEPTNVFAAFLTIAVILALLTPLADPARLSVHDQVRRLAGGKTSAEEFDYDFLRFQSGRYGREALGKLAAQGVGKEPDKVAMLAAEAQKREFPKSIEPKIAPDLAARITVYPAGSKLPESFLAEAWLKSDGAWRVRQCADNPCEAFLIDIDADGKAEILVSSEVYKETDKGWALVGSLSQMYCPSVLEALKRGDYSLAPNPFKDVIAGGARLHFQSYDTACPPSEDAAPTPNPGALK